MAFMKNAPVRHRPAYNCQLLESWRYVSPGILQSSIQRRPDQAPPERPGQGPKARCGRHHRGPHQGRGVWRDLPEIWAGGGSQPKTTTPGTEVCQPDGGKVAAPGHLQAAGQPPQHQEWRQGVEGSPLPHQTAPFVSPTIPEKTPECRDWIV